MTMWSDVVSVASRVRDRLAVVVTGWERRWVRRAHQPKRAPGLPALVRHGDLERLRRIVDDRQREGADRRSRRRGGYAFVRAVLLGAYGSVSAPRVLAETARAVSPRLHRAAVARLLDEDRAVAAWRLVEARPAVRQPLRVLRMLATRLDDDRALDGLIAHVEDPATRLHERHRARIDADALVNRGRSAFDRGDLEPALTRFDAADRRVGTAWTATWMARVLVEFGRTEDAREHAIRASERQPRYRSALLALAEVECRAGATDRALALWRDVADDSGATPEERRVAWEGLTRIGSHADALVVADALVASTDGAADARARRATSLWHLARHGEADELVADLWERFEAQTLRALALYLGRTGRSPQAYDVLARVTVVVRGVQATLELVDALEKDGHWRLAAQAAERARPVFPDDHRLARRGDELHALIDR